MPRAALATSVPSTGLAPGRGCAATNWTCSTGPWPSNGLLNDRRARLRCSASGHPAVVYVIDGYHDPGDDTLVLAAETGHCRPLEPGPPPLRRGRHRRHRDQPAAVRDPLRRSRPVRAVRDRATCWTSYESLALADWPSPATMAPHGDIALPGSRVIGPGPSRPAAGRRSAVRGRGPRAVLPAADGRRAGGQGRVRPPGAGGLPGLPAGLRSQPHARRARHVQHRASRGGRQRFPPLRRRGLPAGLERFGNHLLRPVQPALRVLPELGHLPAARRPRDDRHRHRGRDAAPPTRELSQRELRDSRARGATGGGSHRLRHPPRAESAHRLQHQRL